MAKDAPTPPEGGAGPEPDFSPEAQATRMKQGPMIVTLPPDFEDNPGLPPEVWQTPPPGVSPPQ
jgi:hypothetical protein